MILRNGIVTTCVLAVLGGASAAKADGVCAKGYRDTTAAERATMTQALEGAKRALPAAPSGWAIGGYEELSVMSSLCRDMEADPWTYTFSRNYNRVDDREARDATMRAAAADYAADLKAKQPRLDALMAKMQEITQRQVALIEKGDQAGAQALSFEIEKLSLEYGRIAQEGDPSARIEAAGIEASRDLHIAITVIMNPRRESPDGGAATIALPPGAHSAFRWSETGGSAPEDHALVLIGPWTQAPEGGFQPARRSGGGAAPARAIAVHLRAADTRLASVLASIDFGGLAALLAK